MELYTTTPIDSLQEITLTLYHSGSHIICIFCNETVKDVLLTVVLIVGQFGEPVKCIGVVVNFTSIASIHLHNM